jgi:glycosyltransferase involved in cell wall biosynthesis
MTRSPRILAIAEGGDANALSGVAHHLFAALETRLEVVGRVDYAPSGPRRLALAAATFRPSRAAWRARFHTSLRAHRRLSATLDDRLREVGVEFDLALQVFGWVSGQPHPYALYVDQTRLMAERGWPDWMPLGPRERAELLELERQMYTGAAHIFVMGGAAKESLVADYGNAADRVTVVGGGVNFSHIPAPGARSKDPVILFVGREFARKGGDSLLAAFERVRAQLPGASLHLAGVRERVAAPGVVSHGLITSRDQLASLYRSARVFCLPSRYEPWGLVLAEAMAHGVPCVATETGSIPEILAHGDAGLLVPIDDAERLADALLELLTDDELAVRIGLAARERVEREFTWELVAERIATVLGRD